MPDYLETMLAQRSQQSRPGRPPVSTDQARAYLDRLDRIAGQLTELTTSEAWNLHMAHLTGNKEIRQAELTGLSERIVRGVEFGDALAALKQRAAYLQGAIEAIAEAMGDVREVIDVNRALQGEHAIQTSEPEFS